MKLAIPPFATSVADELIVEFWASSKTLKIFITTVFVFDNELGRRDGTSSVIAANVWVMSTASWTTSAVILAPEEKMSSAYVVLKHWLYTSYYITVSACMYQINHFHKTIVHTSFNNDS